MASNGVDLSVADIYGEAWRLLMAEPRKFAALSAIGLAPSWLSSLHSG